MRNYIVKTEYVRMHRMDDILIPRKIILENRSRTRNGGRGLATTLFSIFILLTSIVLANTSTTISYFSDIEKSLGNILLAGSIDFTVDPNGESMLTLEDSLELAPTMTPEPGSLPIDYKVHSEITGGSENFCNALLVEATTSPFIYSGLLTSLDTATSTLYGPWPFKLSTVTDESKNGDACDFDLVYSGWDSGGDQNDSYTDEERISYSITYGNFINQIQNFGIQRFVAPQSTTTPEDHSGENEDEGEVLGTTTPITKEMEESNSTTTATTIEIEFEEDQEHENNTTTEEIIIEEKDSEPEIEEVQKVEEENPEEKTVQEETPKEPETTVEE